MMFSISEPPLPKLSSDWLDTITSWKKELEAGDLISEKMMLPNGQVIIDEVSDVDEELWDKIANYHKKNDSKKFKTTFKLLPIDLLSDEPHAPTIKEVHAWIHSMMSGTPEMSMIPTLTERCPGLTERVPHPIHGSAHELKVIIQNLNDNHGWSREQIADWLESLDVDLEIKL